MSKNKKNKTNSYLEARYKSGFFFTSLTIYEVYLIQELNKWPSWLFFERLKLINYLKIDSIY